MVPAAQLGLFFLLVLGVVLLPGLDMTFVLATTLARGRRHGLAGILGIVAAGVVHVAVGAAGIATVLAVMPIFFDGMLLAGAGYLAWIGVSLVRGGVSLAAGPGGAEGGGTLAVPFRRGMVTNLLNPKAYAFMLAVFPQFVAAERGPMWIQAVPLAAIIATTQVVVYGAVALAADRTREWLAGHPRALAAVGRSVGLLLLGAALASAAQGWRHLS
jgi:threonine/homoserine/homoserine lactone efflux protein